VDETEPGPRELLAKAIEGLDPGDRERVTAWLLDRSFGGAGGLDPIGIPGAIPQAHSGLGPSLAAARRGEHQVVPIRLPTDRHAALRDWCAEHGFTMATVIRGLVERFLEERGQLPGRPA
jgi:hypothetical protein